MPLSLKSVESGRGTRWITDAWRVFLRRPLAFSGLLASWIFAGMVLSSLLPVVGSVLTLMSPPLVSLGFMIAGQSVLLEGPVSLRQFAEPLLTDKVRRRSLLMLCAAYAVLVMLATMGAMHLADDTLSQLGQLPSGQALTPEELLALLSHEDITQASLFFTLVMGLISAPFWHAPALVHWGGQSAAQALFSSLLAVWRNKLAFAVYFSVLTAMTLALMFSVSLLAVSLLPLPLVALLLALTWTAVGAVFYLSVLFTFNDSFGGTPVQTDDGPQTQPEP